MATKTVKWDLVDDRARSVGGLAVFFIVLQMVNTNADLFFPDIAVTITEMIGFYLPITLGFLVAVLYKSQGKKFPVLPPAYLMVKNYLISFIISVIAVLAFVTFIREVNFVTFTTYSISLNSWVIQLIVGIMENLPLVMLLPVLIPLNIGGTGVKGWIIEYIPSGVVASLSHFKVYWIQTQATATKLEAQGIIINPIYSFIGALIMAYIAFTVFYIVYKRWGFSASVSLHQAWNLINSATGA